MSESEKSFQEPQRVAINRVYTRKGDAGETSLVGGQKVPKSDLRIESYGTVDELNSFVGIARQSAIEASVASEDVRVEGVGTARSEELLRLAKILRKVQHQLFNLGSILATLPEDIHPKQPRVRAADVTWLEQEMDRVNAHLEPLRSFVLPGGSRLNADLHVCRTVCRRVERDVCRLAAAETVDNDVISYLNRLSDAFFVWSRWSAHVAGLAETLWQPNAADDEIQLP